MANRRTVMIDGKKHDITNTQESWEMTCDGCGEYADVAQLVILQGKMAWEAADQAAYSLDLHVRCLHKLPELLASRAASVPPF